MLKNSKGKGSPPPEEISKDQLEVSPLEGVTRKRKLVLKSAMNSMKAKVNIILTYKVFLA